ncbi:protein cereblon-like [Dendronephthya gigantea]|uniref:protein cereblon-like n=1 Tax=Dendronephthya gigantea TaxID=151771 RepID=UPI00106A8E3A|nr:protein cereblon-like [Dendronephthya gigantea]XP_028405729.1 protein cereblon-like [Dendronephthya gigantea]
MADEMEDGYEGPMEELHIDSSDDEYLDVVEELNFHAASPETDDDETIEEDKKETIKFDQSLPSSHTYLGEEMDEVTGRTVMEEDNVVSIPVISLPNLLLVPGQTLPMYIFNPQLVAMMKNLLDKDNTFGVVTGNRGLLVNSPEDIKRITGTTCEIYSMKEENEAGISTISIKAMARKRFQVLSLRTQLDGTRIGTVRILPDVLMPAYPRNALAECVRPTRLVTSHLQATARLNQSLSKSVPSCSAWSSWVYELYNPYLLVARIKQELKSWIENLKTETLPTEATEFSYWVTHNLPLDNNRRDALLKMDCPIQRLRKQLEIMQKYGIMICNDCRSIIADKKDLFSMSLTGLMGAYVNPGGHVFETVTFHKAKGLRLRGPSSTEHSWFPGYAWTIAECRHCGKHMGWKFTAVNKKLVPNKFWGLTRASLRPSLRHEEEEEI